VPAARATAPDVLDVREESTLAAVPRPDWNRLAASADFYHSHEWLMGQEGARGIECAYVLAYDGGALVGGLPLHRLAENRRGECNELFGRELELLLAGPRTGYRTQLLVDPHAPPSRARAIRDALVRRAGDVARRFGCEGLWFDYVTTAGLQAVVDCAGGIAAFRTAESRIDTDGAGFDGYLGMLSSSMRSQARREMRRFESAGWRVSTERLSASVEEAAALFAETERKYGHLAHAARIREFLLRQVPHVDGRSVAFACRDELGRLVGYSLMFEWSGTLFARQVGFDYARLRDSFEYFNLLFYLPLRYMEARGLDTLHLGIFGGWDAKGRRAARFHPLWACAVVDDGRVRWHRAVASRSFAAEVKERFPDAVDLPEWDPRGLL
jgi:predicted N-acyltransferase